MEATEQPPPVQALESAEELSHAEEELEELATLVPPHVQVAEALAASEVLERSRRAQLGVRHRSVSA